MGISPAIFESAGKRTEHLIPGAYSRSASVPAGGGGVSAGNGVILGHSTGGKPLHIYTFNTLSEAIEALTAGELLEAVGYAFSPNGDYTPQSVRAVRVNTGTQATLTLKSGQDPVMVLRSWDYGTHMNQLKFLLTADADGKPKATLSYRGNEEVIENIYTESIGIRLSDESDDMVAIININSAGLELSRRIPGAENEPDSFSDVQTFTFADFPTIGELIDKLNDTGLVSAVMLGTDGNAPSYELDLRIGGQISGLPANEYAKFTSTYYALFHALEQSVMVGAGNVSKPNSADNTMPDINNTNPVPLYFTGGTEGESNIEKWQEALAVIEGEDIQCIATPSTEFAVHALISNHCTAMNSVTNRKERTAFLGGRIGEPIDEALGYAKLLNSKFVSYCYPSIRAASPISGAIAHVPASYFACKLLGMEMGAPVNTPLTWKDVNVLDFGKHLKNSDLEALIKGGVLAGGVSDDGRLVVIRAMTTYQGNLLQLCERSMVREDLYMNRDLRLRFQGAIGQPSLEPSGASDLATLNLAAQDWATQGLINKNESGKNVWGITISYSGDQVRISFNRNLTPPKNFFFLTANNFVYTSSSALVVA
jgi:hypothetical protein